MRVCSVAQSRVTLATLWTVARQAPLSMGLPRQEYWSGLSFPPPGDLPDPGMEFKSPALAGRFVTTEAPGEPTHVNTCTTKPGAPRRPGGNI